MAVDRRAGHHGGRVAELLQGLDKENLETARNFLSWLSEQ